MFSSLFWLTLSKIPLARIKVFKDYKPQTNEILTQNMTKQKNQEMIGVKRCLNSSPVWLVLHFLSHLPFPNITSIPSISAFPNAPLSNLAPGCAMGPWQKPQQAVFIAAYGWVVTKYQQKKGQIFRCQETGGEKNLGGTCEMFLSFNLAKQLILTKSTMHSTIY